MKEKQNIPTTNNQQPTTVLVTGANGQLGQCIKDLEGQHPDLKFIYTDYHDLDITNFEAVNSFFKTHGTIQYCINCAAYTAVDKAEDDKETAFLINAVGPKHLALACKEYNTILIHISTDFVFDGHKTEPYTETDIPNPISVYGDTKLQGEKEIEKILQKHFIIRSSWLYSEHGHNFMKTMLRLAETKDEISVVNDQIGTPTYAGDLAGVLLRLISGNSKKYGTYHYSNEGEASWYDFARAILAEAHSKTTIHPIKTSAFPTLATRPPYSVLDKTKIKDTLRIAINDWQDSLPKALAALRAIEQ